LYYIRLSQYKKIKEKVLIWFCNLDSNGLVYCIQKHCFGLGQKYTDLGLEAKYKCTIGSGTVDDIDWPGEISTSYYKKAQLTQGLRATAPSLQNGGCSKMAVSRHLGFNRTANSAIRSADPENPSLEPNMEWIGCTVCEIFAFKLYCDLETGVRGHSRSSKMAPFDRAHTALYSFSIVNMPLSLAVSEI